MRGRGNDRYFKARGRTLEGGYRLKLTLDSWRGYGAEYDFRYRTSDPGEFHLYGIEGPFSNLYGPPGTAGFYAGGVGFARGGKRMPVGSLPISNQDHSEGVILAGSMRCR